MLIINNKVELTLQGQKGALIMQERVINVKNVFDTYPSTGSDISELCNIGKSAPSRINTRHGISLTR